MYFRERIKRKFTLIATLILTLLVYTTIKFVLPVAAENNDSDKEKTILIDAGHGGYDGGADGKSGVKEKDINLNISLKLRDKLIEKGYNVIMIRDEDKALLDEGKRTGTKKAQDIANRCRIKRESNVDVFISIHQNYFPQGKYYGSQVWYSNSEESRILARLIQENLKVDLDNNNKRVEKPAKNDYKILSCDNIIPSVLIECGFLSNYEEEKLLQDDGYQRKIADSVAKSIDSYFQKH